MRPDPNGVAVIVPGAPDGVPEGKVQGALEAPVEDVADSEVRDRVPAEIPAHRSLGGRANALASALVHVAVVAYQPGVRDVIPAAADLVKALDALHLTGAILVAFLALVWLTAVVYG